MSGGAQCFRRPAPCPAAVTQPSCLGRHGRDKFTGPYPFCPSFRQTRRGPVPGSAGFGDMGVGMSKWQLMTRRLPTLRFRAKIILGFGLVLAISAVSLYIAYLGFEKVSSAVASWRTSVSEADLARNIDRELIAYRGLARYYVVTAKDDDAKAAQAAEARLKDAIEASMRGTSNPARLDQITRLSKEFQSFAKIFAEIVQVKSESALLGAEQAVARRQHAAIQARRSSQQCRRRGAAGDPVRHQESDRAIPVGLGACQHLRHQCRSGDRHRRDGAAQIRRERARRGQFDERADRGRPEGGGGTACRIPGDAGQS